MSDRPTSVLFVCLGNICRSPLAEGVFLHRAREAGVDGRFRVDSCGTGGWHVGQRPDRRSIAVAEKHGIELPGRARRHAPPGDHAFDLIIPMDVMNRDDLLASGAPRERVRLLRTFDPAMARATEGELEVPDPYQGGLGGFDTVFEMVDASVRGMLDELLEEPT